jgi:predicted ATPase
VCREDEALPLFARTFHTVFIEDVPRFSAAPEGRATAKRFFKLVEALHAVGTKCVFHAETDVAHLIAPSNVPFVAAPEVKPELVGAGATPEPDAAKEGFTAAASDVAVSKAAPPHTTLQEMEQGEVMLREHEEFALATRNCEIMLAEMQTVEYLRKPHTGKPVSLTDGAPNALEIMARFDALQAADAAAGIDPEAEFEGSVLTRHFAKRPTRMQ